MPYMPEWFTLADLVERNRKHKTRKLGAGCFFDWAWFFAVPPGTKNRKNRASSPPCEAPLTAIICFFTCWRSWNMTWKADGQTVLNVDERCLSCCGKAQTVLSGRTDHAWFTFIQFGIIAKSLFPSCDSVRTVPTCRSNEVLPCSPCSAGFKMACLQYSPAPVLFAYISQHYHHYHHCHHELVMMLMWPRRTTYNRSDLLGLREKMLAQVDEVFAEYWQWVDSCWFWFSVKIVKSAFNVICQGLRGQDVESDDEFTIPVTSFLVFLAPTAVLNPLCKFKEG